MIKHKFRFSWQAFETGSAKEWHDKARKAVTKALTDARDAIVKELPYMEDMLSEVKPGLKIVYLPQNQPVELLTSPLQK